MAYDRHARPFFVHPYVQAQGDHRTPAEQRRLNTPEEITPSRLEQSGRPMKSSPQSPAVRRMMAEMKMSLATKQLSEQVKESIRFWRKFRNEYSAEVNSIKLYVGLDVLHQIWREKVDHNDRAKRGTREDGQQFVIQSVKLESCLGQVDEATQLLAETKSSDHSGDYDSQQHHLVKIRAAGDLVVGLSKRSAANETACLDLLEELASLDKLINSKNSAVAIPHHTDKHESKFSTRPEPGGIESRSPDPPVDGYTEEMQGEQIGNNLNVEQDDQDNWQGYDEGAN
ncbi:hypothetical protein F4777DRAFT_17030 [Nemania sp. FL0916]|nr:hypothetical protein F4777DRAFT_17030 [Nemania sp. FL0916]